MTSLCTRAEDRDSFFLIAELTFESDLPETRVKVRNLSARGMMVESELWVKRGTRVEATLHNIGQVTGTVVWVRTPRLGIAFEKEIDPKLARREVYGGAKEAPGFARAAVSAPRHDGWNGKLRRV